MWWYLAVMNTLGFALMGLDKKRAGEHQWRISERTLFLVAALGGSVELAWNVYFSPQNKALVFRDRNTGDFCIAKHFVVLYNDE